MASKWGRLIAITGGGQALVQVIGFATGIIIIRSLSVEQYAFYTLATSILGTMSIMANGGVASGVMVQGGKVWQNRSRLGGVITYGIQLRRQMAVYSFALAGPILVWLLLRNGASWWLALCIAGAVVPAFIATLSGRILDAPLRLHQQVWPMQRIFVGSNLLRFATTVPVMLVWPAAVAALLVNGLADVVANIRLRRAAAPYADLKAAPDAEVKPAILAMVRRVLPNAVYFSVSSQIGVFLVSFFGSAVAIAQLGALSRIGLVLALAKAVVMTLFVPRFTKLPVSSPLIVKRFFQVQTMLWLLSVVSMTGVWLFAEPILWLLGSEYKSLRLELILMAASSLAALAAFTTERLNESRAWVVAPRYFIPCSLVLQVGLAVALRPSTSATAFIYGLCVQFATYLGFIVFFLWRVRRDKTVSL